MKKGLQNNLPFKEVTAKKTDAGIKKQIKNRDVSMVVIIPQGFSSDVQSGRPVQLKYYRGTANGMIETMAQRTAVSQINSKVKEQIQSKTMAGMIARQMQPQMESQMKSEMQSKVQAQIQARIKASNIVIRFKAIKARCWLFKESSFFIIPIFMNREQLTSIRIW